MSINFYEASCQEPALTNALFGLCDDMTGAKAYTSTTEISKWIATVKNDNNKSLVFTAIDKCIIKDYEYPSQGRCDGMLTSDVHIYFIELKDQTKGWISDAVEQLKSTVELFISSHDINIYKHKKAFACNKQRPHFQETDNEFNLRFFRKYKVRIDVQAEIIVV